MATGQRKSESLLMSREDSKSSIHSMSTSPLPPSPPSRSHTPSQAHPSSPHSADLPAPLPPSSHRSPPHPSQPHLQGLSGFPTNSPTIQSQLLTSITQRTTSIKGDSGHRRFSDIDVNNTAHERQAEGDSYSPRPDRKVRKSNSVKDTAVHGISNRPPYPIPSASATRSSEMSSRMSGGKVSVCILSFLIVLYFRCLIQWRAICSFSIY